MYLFSITPHLPLALDELQTPPEAKLKQPKRKTKQDEDIENIRVIRSKIIFPNKSSSQQQCEVRVKGGIPSKLFT